MANGDTDRPRSSAEVGAYWEGNAEAWTRLSRAGHDIYRDVLNTPAFLAILPDITGFTGLDIGCGEGSNTRKLAERGAKITAIDIAPTFIAHARETENEAPLGIAYQLGDAAALPFDDETFDFATAFMSLMDVPEQAKAVAEAFRVLRPGGFFQFSILHPCFAPGTRRVVRDDGGNVLAIEVADYFDDDYGFPESWCFSTAPDADKAKPFIVPRFHNTLSQWVAFLCDASFVIEELGEPRASTQVAELHPKVADTRVAPLFLHIRARKPG